LPRAMDGPPESRRSMSAPRVASSTVGGAADGVKPRRSSGRAPLGAARPEAVVHPRSLRFAIAAALAPVLMFGSLCILDSRSFIVFPDSQVQDYAWMQKRTRSLHEGHLALWNPNTTAGSSFPGELQAGVFYPLNVLWAVIFGSASGMSSSALDALVLLHFALAGLGMSLLLRTWSLSPPASLFGAVVFACLGPLP